jgi:hypothetical protein
LAGSDPIKIETFSKMPLLEYYIILNRNLAESKKQALKTKK